MLLRVRVMSAGEIAACFAISRPAVSRHLRVLRECGLVIDDVQGRQRLYRLETAPLESLYRAGPVARPLVRSARNPG